MENPNHPRAAGNKIYYENALAEEGGTMQRKGKTRQWSTNEDGDLFLLSSLGEDGLGDAIETSEFTIAEQTSNGELKAQERINYERLCRGEDMLSDE